MDMTGPILSIIVLTLIIILTIIHYNTKKVIIYKNEYENRRKYKNDESIRYKKPDPNRYRSQPCRNTDCGCCPNSNRQKFDIKGSNC